jgi:hypothetical protein
MEYLIKNLIDKGLNIDALPAKIKEDINVINVLSKNFSVDNEDVRQLDKIVHNQIMSNYANLINGNGNGKENPFKNDNYFKNNPDKVLGTQTIGGRFGTSVMVTGNIENINHIPVINVNKTFRDFSDIVASNTVIEEATQKAIRKYKDKKTELSRTILEGDDYYTFREVLNMYNQNITRKELEAYLYTHPNLPREKYIDNFENTQDELIQEGYIYYIQNSFQYKYLYLSGNINQKITYCKNFDKEKIIDRWGESTYNNQMQILEATRPTKKRVSEIIDDDERLYLHPNSDFCRTFKLNEIIGYETTETLSLREWFEKYVTSVINFAEVGNSNKNNIINLYVNQKNYSRSPKRTGENDASHKARVQREEYEFMVSKENAIKEGERLFNSFLANNLLVEDKLRLEIEWNEVFNGLAIPDYDKIPVAFTIAKKFKNDVPLRLSSVQIRGVRFFAAIKSGCLSYEVGLGKTLSAIACISYVVENNLANYPLIVVPLNTYYSGWVTEVAGYKIDNTELKGALRHFPKIRDFSNLNADVVSKTKNYTKDEQAEMDYLYDLRVEVKGIIKDLDNKKIKELPLWLELESKNKFVQIYLNCKKNAEEWAVAQTNELQKAHNLAFNKRLQSLGRTATIEEQEKQKSEAEEIADSVYAEIPILTLKKFEKFLRETYIFDIYEFGEFPEVEAGTITIITYEGLKNIGIRNNEETIRHIFEIVSQGDVYDEDERKKQKLKEKIVRIVSGKIGNPKVILEDLGIDMMVIDEAHKAKKIFTSVKGRLKDEEELNKARSKSKSKNVQERENSTSDLESGEPSITALAAYSIGSFIQRNNEGRNILGLTATPFENNPLEIYSMLSLFNHDILEKWGYGSIRTFFDTFTKIAYEIKITADFKIKIGSVLKAFNNISQMRLLIRSVIDHRTGEQEDISRPNKVVLPSEKLNVKTSFRMTPLQEQYKQALESYVEGIVTWSQICDQSMEEIMEVTQFLKDLTKEERKEMLDDMFRNDPKEIETFKDELTKTELKTYLGMDDEEADEEIQKRSRGVFIDESMLNDNDSRAVRIMQAISANMQIALSPYLFRCYTAAKATPSPEELINTSPKLKYTIECIKSVRQHHIDTATKMSGQIIYMPRGVKMFPLIEQYLTEPTYGINFAKDEVGIIMGGMSNAKKEAVKKAFNKGLIKVLIASDTIQVGVNLQENSSVLYMLHFNWNPTIQTQVEGRIWRYGNRFANVRIVYPMLENSIDPIIFQYLYEKTMRLKEIWDLQGVKSQLDLTDFDPERFRRELLTDPVKIAEWEIQSEGIKLAGETAYTQNMKNQISNVIPDLRRLISLMYSVQIGIAEYYTGIREIEKRQIDKVKYDKLIPYQLQLNNLDNDKTLNEIENKRDQEIKVKQELLLDPKIEMKAIRAVQSEIQKIKENAEKEIAKYNKEKEEKKAKLVKAIKDINDRYAKQHLEAETMGEDILQAINNPNPPHNIIDGDYSNINTNEFFDYLAMLYAESNKMIKWLDSDSPEYLYEDEFVNKFAFNKKDWIAKFNNFRAKRKNFVFDTYRKVIEPMKIGINEVGGLEAIYENKLIELHGQIESLEASRPKRIERISMELEGRSDDWKTPKEQAQSFAEINYLLNETYDPSTKKHTTQPIENLSKELNTLHLRLKILRIASQRMPAKWIDKEIADIEKVMGASIMKFGGNVSGGCDGGCIVEGKRHSEGGEKFTLKNSGKVVELEVDEAVLSPQAVNNNKTYDFNGKKLTPREIMSEINQSGGGVPIMANGGELQEGQVVITRNAVLDNNKKFTFEGKPMTNKEILNKLNTDAGGNPIN